MSTDAIRFDLTIRQGSTYAQSLQWMQERKTYAAITAIPQLVPVRVTAVAHGAPDGWPVFITGIEGAVELNTTDFTAPYTASKIDADTLELMNVNGEDFGAYVAEGYVEYYTPFDLSTYTSATLVIRDSQGSATVLDTFAFASTGVSFDNTLKLINLSRTATQTAAYNWAANSVPNEGWYDLDATHSSGRIDRVSYGRVALARA